MKGSDSEKGIIPLSLEYLFDNFTDGTTKEGKTIRRTVGLSYLEIYNETINDLLKHNNSNLKLRMQEDKSLFIQDLTIQEVHNSQEAMHFL